MAKMAASIVKAIEAVEAEAEEIKTAVDSVESRTATKVDAAKFVVDEQKVDAFIDQYLGKVPAAAFAAARTGIRRRCRVRPSVMRDRAVPGVARLMGERRRWPQRSRGRARTVIGGSSPTSHAASGNAPRQLGSEPLYAVARGRTVRAAVRPSTAPRPATTQLPDEEDTTVGDTSPRQHRSTKSGQSLKEKRTEKKEKQAA